MANLNLANNPPQICCIGARRLGSFSTLALAHQYPNIDFFIADEDINLIDRWNNHNQLPFKEPQLNNLVAQHRDQNVFFTGDIIDAIQDSAIIFIAIEMRTKKEGVGEKGRIEVGAWKRMVELIRDHAQGMKIIIDKSSVPFEERNTIMRVLEPGQHVHQVFTNPEFFSEGTAFQTLLDPQRRVVFGTRSMNANIDILHQLYQFTQNRVVIDATTLDFAKIFNNMLLGCMATLANIGSTFGDDLRINMNEVFRVINDDNRLGNGLFLSPNVAVGGLALQRDMAYMADELNHKEIAILLKTFIDVNKKRKEKFVKKMLNAMLSLEGKTIVVLGFAFKQGTEDVSDSPAIHMCECLLKKEKATLRIYDPIVGGNVVRRCLRANGGQWAQQLLLMPLNQQLFQGADAICVMTREPQFVALPFANIRMDMNNPPYFFDFTGDINFDLNAIRVAGFQVYSSGRQ